VRTADTVKQLLPKVKPCCTGAELPPRAQHVPLPQRASAPGVRGSGLDWSRAGDLIHVCHALVRDRMEFLE